MQRNCHFLVAVNDSFTFTSLYNRYIQDAILADNLKDQDTQKTGPSDANIGLPHQISGDQSIVYRPL